MTSECPTCGDSFVDDVGMKSHHKQAHDESLAGFEHTCSNCGEVFESATREREYCSLDCLTSSQVERVERECVSCGSTFTTIPSREQKNCSRECAIQYMEEEFSGRDSHLWEGKISKECQVCGKEMALSDWESDRVVCSRECYKKYISENYSGEDSWHWKENTAEKYDTKWEILAESVRKENENKCAKCGEYCDGKASVHHIIPMSEFEDQSEAHYRENLVPLCRSCHGVVEEWSCEKQIEEFNRDPDELQV